MTDHKPECPMLDDQWPKHPLEKCPYCDMIAACEQRCDEKRQAEVRAWSELSRDNFADGFAAGLDAAREAVRSLPPSDGDQIKKQDALAVIDALREEEPMTSGGIYAGPSIPLGDGCVIPKSGSRHVGRSHD